MVYRRDYRRNVPRRSGLLDNFSLTWIIIILNTIIFFISFILLSIYPDIVNYLAISSNNFFGKLYLWTAFSSMFMHGGIAHLFFNMFTLFFLGSFVERIIGKKRYLWFYIIAGIFGALFFVGFAYLGQFFSLGETLFGAVDDLAVGASGAIFGLLGLLAVLLPNKRLYLIAGPLIVIIFQFLIVGIVPEAQDSISLFANVLILLMIFAIFSSNPRFRSLSVPIEMPFWLTPFVAIIPLLIIGLFIKLPIGNTAHLGGLVVGLIYGFYLRKKFYRKVKLLNRMVG